MEIGYSADRWKRKSVAKKERETDVPSFVQHTARWIVSLYDGTRVQRLSAWRIRKYSRAFDFPAISNPTGQRAIGEVAEAYSKGTGQVWACPSYLQNLKRDWQYGTENIHRQNGNFPKGLFWADCPCQRGYHKSCGNQKIWAECKFLPTEVYGQCKRIGTNENQIQRTERKVQTFSWSVGTFPRSC